MRALALLAFVAAPAFAQDGVGYDDGLLSACLDETATAHAQTDIEDDPLRGCIGKAAIACMEAPGGDTTAGMSECLRREVREWDMLMTAWQDGALRQARAADDELKELGSAADPAAPALERAQAAWAAYRDAACLYESLRYQGGTAGGPASADCLLQLTADRALRLRDIAEP